MTQVYYDRDQTVAIITSFYQFFATLPSISPSDIAYPPPGGWPDITPETHAALQKNDDVIDLYKHLPYLNKRPEISYLTYASDWRLQNIESKIQSEAVEESAVGPLPDYVAILTDGNKYGSYLLLDTQNGTITDFRKQEHPKRKEPPVGSPDHWKAYLTLPTSIFFESWKEKFRSREFLVIPENEDDGLLIGWDVEKAERSMLKFKARIEAEIFASEMESFEEDMFTEIVSEYEEWLGDPAEEERSFLVCMFGGMDWEDIQIEMSEAKARRDAEIFETEQQELVAEMEEDEEMIERLEVCLFGEHRWNESIVYL